MASHALKTHQFKSGPSFLKWAGGKRQLLPEILSRLPKHFDRYFEPMCGGAAVYFGLRESGFRTPAFLGDINPDLVEAYLEIRDHLEKVLEYMDVWYNKNEEDFYYAVRAADKTKIPPAERVARLIYLNRTCFNGLYRVNKAGQFNVPFGRYTAPTICDRETLMAAHLELADRTEIRCCHYGDILTQAVAGDFVYFDPPYVPLSDTSNFTSFTTDGFDNFDHLMLAEVVGELHKKNVAVMLSNSDTPFTRDLYKAFTVETVRATRSINSKGERRGPVDELLVRTYA